MGSTLLRVDSSGCLGEMAYENDYSYKIFNSMNKGYLHLYDNTRR